ncbi:hypothetical protein PAXRUDRAFT_152565 [Paxillus rubicundulus Ve08.2h10]|uniref:CCHC-type domain-containing protein n=1 Tax=Paxillus rubicundulus Ve08.2h10 TaxID=930991 RepID=A0A0D0DL90_9AGAM|nr:hypothetical protein PAXRUDRAFT_152565 [Paxillus rubicundulus Ve08.2h10]
MGCLIPNNEFQLILVTSFPESWDHFSTSYCSTQSGAESAGTCKVTTQELYNIIGDKYHCHKRESRLDDIDDEHVGTSTSMTTYYTKDTGQGKKWKVDKLMTPAKYGKPKCNNCRWFGHITADCHRKGGVKDELVKKKSMLKSNKGKEHANQAHNVKEDEEIDVAFNTPYDVSLNENDDTIDMYSWVMDSVTMSYICNN